MSTRSTDDTNQPGQQAELNPLMAVYNPLPPQPDQPARFYWQEPWHEADSDGVAVDGAIQSAFEL
jgi:hypothetical protein